VIVGAVVYLGLCLGIVAPTGHVVTTPTIPVVTTVPGFDVGANPPAAIATPRHHRHWGVR
jgi:hypothetical protein